MTAYTVTVEYWTPKTHDEARYDEIAVVAECARDAEISAMEQVDARGGSVEVTRAMAIEDEEQDDARPPLSEATPHGSGLSASSDPLMGACLHYVALVKDLNAKPRHINRARAAVIQAAVRGMDDAQIADVLAFGRPVTTEPEYAR